MVRWVLVCWFAVLTLGRAEMVFEKKEVEIEVPYDQQVVTAAFPFRVVERNTELKLIEFKCTCLEARITEGRLRWKVGEEGMILVDFDSKRVVGDAEKEVFLVFEGGLEKVRLAVKIHVKPLFSVEPPGVGWDVGSEGDERVVRLRKNYEESSAQIVSHSSTNKERFPYEFKELKKGHLYEVRVKAEDTEKRGVATITFRTDSQVGKFKRARLSLRVLNPKHTDVDVATPAQLEPKKEGGAGSEKSSKFGWMVVAVPAGIMAVFLSYFLMVKRRSAS